MNADENKSEISRIVMINLSSVLDFPNDFQRNYHTHLLCENGILTFTFNDSSFKCKRGEFLFWFAKSRLANLKFSKNFRAKVLLVEDRFLLDNIPDQNLGIDATLHSRRYPVLQLFDKRDKHRVTKNFQLLYDKFLDRDHRFYEEALKTQMRMFVLEMWHTFAKEFEQRRRSLQTGTLYERFIDLVQEHCPKKREVQHYADHLSITPKYLNVICKQNSGITASEWIQRFTRERIILLLQNDNLNIAEIAYEMEFSSRSFFTRYVKKVIGVTPREYRNRMSNN